MEYKKCIICGKDIINRVSKEAKTCCQSCAGKLAWETMGGQNEIKL